MPRERVGHLWILHAKSVPRHGLWERRGVGPSPRRAGAKQTGRGAPLHQSAPPQYLVFKAIEAVEVPIAILTYFVYPLLTGLAAAASGLERVTWRGAAAAIAAFLGLALMIGAHPTTLAATGILAALGAAVCRVAILLVTRGLLSGADPMRITWYSLLSSTAIFVVVALATRNWQPPASASGWLDLIGLSAAVTTGLLRVFASTLRIGPFRTALFMNLEPLLTAIGSAA